MRLRTITLPLAAAMLFLMTPVVAAGAGSILSASTGTGIEPLADGSDSFIRCAGLYTAFLKHARSLAPSVVPAIQGSIKALTIEAAEARAEVRGGTRDRYRAAIEDETRAVGAVYAQQLEKNYEASGDPFKGDAQIQSDMTLCKRLTDRLERQPDPTGPRN
ncbi:MAG: hypothetical protein AB7T40_05825 [Alphaproteobacteria bacterium]